MNEKDKKWRGFDTFLIQRWSKVPIPQGLVDEKLEYRIRRNAYHNLMTKIRNDHVADDHTIRRWFGLGGLKKPNRETFFRLAFAIPLSAKEAQEYLINGLLMPGIQINDYEEMIYLYGLENGLSYGVCQGMIQIFERYLVQLKEPVQVTHTDQLMKLYQSQKHKSTEEFLAWMGKNCKLFKGYSKTTLNYYMMLIQEIQEWMKKEAKEYLFFLLEEMDYSNSYKLDSPEEIEKYIQKEKRKKRYSKSLIRNIWYYYRLVYTERKANTDILAELYSSVIVMDKGKKRYRSPKEYHLPKDIKFLTDKQLSDLLHIGTQKACYIKLRQAEAKLSQLADEEKCPEEVQKVFSIFQRKKMVNTVEDAKREVAYLCKQQKQRCHLVQREDMLVFLHYLAQKKYFHEINEDYSKYKKEDAIEYFVNMSDGILSACGMASISEEYEIDSFLLSGFGESEMFSLSDLIELVEDKRS